MQDTNVHYIDQDMRLKSHCLAVTENKESHTAANYRENVDEVTEEFGIKEKIVKTVTDNENKMKAVFDDEERTGCMAHIIHNSVTNGFKQVEEVKELIEKNRRIATKYHKSYAFKSKLRRSKSSAVFQLELLFKMSQHDGAAQGHQPVPFWTRKIKTRTQSTTKGQTSSKTSS